MAANERPAVWWREPMVWLVVGGPVSVVCASIVTAVIAWHGADAMVSVETDAGRPQAMQPALRVRNQGAAQR